MANKNSNQEKNNKKRKYECLKENLKNNEMSRVSKKGNEARSEMGHKILNGLKKQNPKTKKDSQNKSRIQSKIYNSNFTEKGLQSKEKNLKKMSIEDIFSEDVKEKNKVQNKRKQENFDVRGRYENRMLTEEGNPVYTFKELNIGLCEESTELCPFECDCCF